MQDTPWTPEVYRRKLNGCAISVSELTDGSWLVHGRNSTGGGLQETVDSLPVAMLTADTWADPDPVPPGLLDRLLESIKQTPQVPA